MNSHSASAARSLTLTKAYTPTGARHIPTTPHLASGKIYREKSKPFIQTLPPTRATVAFTARKLQSSSADTAITNFSPKRKAEHLAGEPSPKKFKYPTFSPQKKKYEALFQNSGQ